MMNIKTQKRTGKEVKESGVLDYLNGWGNAIRKYPELQKTTTLCLQDQ